MIFLLQGSGQTDLARKQTKIIVKSIPCPMSRAHVHGEAQAQSKVEYIRPILPVTSPALGSDDLSLDQSGTSIQILPEPNAVT